MQILSARAYQIGEGLVDKHSQAGDLARVGASSSVLMIMLF
jgi:hypothetical protein